MHKQFASIFKPHCLRRGVNWRHRKLVMKYQLRSNYAVLDVAKSYRKKNSFMQFLKWQLASGLFI